MLNSALAEVLRHLLLGSSPGSQLGVGAVEGLEVGGVGLGVVPEVLEMIDMEGFE